MFPAALEREAHLWSAAHHHGWSVSDVLDADLETLERYIAYSSGRIRGERARG